ncbi:hypothetical protein ABB55_14290 [Prosthecomicrobium hirschii]|uniref:Uncharacterized protein n=1 Tax=Prosthecodimorpha hirschii TaxID=665126 RepID=A0A0P6VN23_9HYPH|nr:hypothetical protein [Prosthecomicrobium hirschii]KPL53237.1 hypothetical protein ABB55_14290 [Prosthecomicrobium hirschii]
MNAIIKPGRPLIYMKVGTHAGETLEDIIARKQKEIDEAGIAMWGYGGGTCHPRTMVQPFAEGFAERNEPIVLVMEAMNSKHFAEPTLATEYSIDGIHWRPVPHGVSVKGSRYALVLKNLRHAELMLPLAQTAVAIGNCRGRSGNRYIKGRVDKACLTVTDAPELSNEVPNREASISLVAELEKPYAVFVRGAA